MEASEVTFQPPYLSWSTFDGIVEQFRTQGLPAQIDRSVLRSRSGGDQSQFLRAGENFGLIDGNGAPTERLRQYVTDPAGRPAIMRDILQESYAEVVALPTDATPQMLTERFRAFGIEGDTVRKAIAFYLNAARFSKLELSPHFKATRPGAGGRRTRRTASRTLSDHNAGQSENPPPPPANPLGGLHPAIVTLVQSLPTFGDDGAKPKFSTAQRQTWFAYARATFDLIYDRPEGDDGDAEL